MLRGTRIITGDDVKIFNGVIDTLRGSVHQRWL